MKYIKRKKIHLLFSYLPSAYLPNPHLPSTFFPSTSGQALVTLLVFMIVAITIVTASVGVVLTNSLAAGATAQTTSARSIAESGIENALIRLARDPSYTGEILTIGDGSAQVSVTGTSVKTITSVGIDGNFKRTITVIASQSAYIWSIGSWKETY